MLTNPPTPKEAAHDAGLRYVTDARPGISRKRSGKGWHYTTPDGDTLKDKAALARIKALAIPPAWREVWISPTPNGHIQATGLDIKGRKQYRYHPHWREVRDRAKYERMIAFGKSLPRIRKRVERDLTRPGLPREKVIAAVVRLLETTLIRVGNEEYALTNKSYGLTTMRNRHVKVTGTNLRFNFRGKSGKDHNVSIKSKRLARIVAQCQELPGQELFSYQSADNTPHTIDSGDINAYLKEISNDDFTAKDFRTWAGTVLAATSLQKMEPVETKTQAKHNVVAAIEQVANRLGNTPAISRKSYVHPAIIETYLEGTLPKTLTRKPKKHPKNLHSEEASVLRLLQILQHPKRMHKKK